MPNELTRQMAASKAKAKLEEVMDYLIEDSIKWSRDLSDKQLAVIIAEAAEDLKHDVLGDEEVE